MAALVDGVGAPEVMVYRDGDDGGQREGLTALVRRVREEDGGGSPEVTAAGGAWASR